MAILNKFEKFKIIEKENPNNGQDTQKSQFIYYLKIPTNLVLQTI